jgi:ribosome modulation factor
VGKYRDESLDDAADRLFEEHRQQLCDANADGRKVGRMGLGAGLCPQGYSNDERDEWLKGFAEGAASLLTERRAA